MTWWYYGTYISKVHTLGNSTIKNITQVTVKRLKAITPRLVKEQQWYWSSFDLWTIRVQRYTSDRISGLGIRRLVALLLRDPQEFIPALPIKLICGDIEN